MKRSYPPGPKVASLWIGVVLALIPFGLALTSAKVKSATFDEDAYIGKGTAIWLEGNYWLRTAHPALAPMLGTSLLLTEPELSAPTDQPCWPDGTARSCGRELLFYRSDTRRVLFLVRLPITYLMVTLVALVYRWAAELYGRRAALLPAMLCALDPNLLAHGRLLTLDLVATFFVFLSCWTFYRFWARPGWGRLAAVGLALGAAGSARFTTGFLVPLFLVLGLARTWHLCRAELLFVSNALPRWRAVVVALVALVMVGGIAVLVIWIVHGADFGPVPRWGGIRLPAPAYFNELAALLEYRDKPQDAFLLGYHYKGGWWLYFIVAFFVKTPLPTILMVGFALVCLVQQRGGGFGEAVLLTVAGSYFGLSLLSPFNIGYRHLLPMLPLLFVFAGRAVRVGELGPHLRLRPVPAALLVWLTLSNLAIYPHYLAYFNEPVGPRNGYRVLVDSNLDWGQDLPALEQYV
ncbi:MAG TPA: phospholipid carrier-dependent glycosyltransferase, partial [Anaerolineae bacterium]|nr:phospholipid carrier-dependent glycosyltransferase [Anaerolineae bacterium]